MQYEIRPDGQFWWKLLNTITGEAICTGKTWGHCYRMKLALIGNGEVRAEV